MLSDFWAIIWARTEHSRVNSAELSVSAVGAKLATGLASGSLNRQSSLSFTSFLCSKSVSVSSTTWSGITSVGGVSWRSAANLLWKIIILTNILRLPWKTLYFHNLWKGFQLLYTKFQELFSSSWAPPGVNWPHISFLWCPRFIYSGS